MERFRSFRACTHGDGLPKPLAHAFAYFLPKYPISRRRRHKNNQKGVWGERV